MTAKEFFGDEEFFQDHKRLHNARAASHNVFALFLPSIVRLYIFINARHYRN